MVRLGCERKQNGNYRNWVDGAELAMLVEGSGTTPCVRCAQFRGRSGFVDRRVMQLRKKFRLLEPQMLAMLDGPLLSRARPWLDKHDVFSFRRKPLAMGAAVGIFCSLIPGPFQLPFMLLVCGWLRANVIAGAVATLFTNPLTIVPLYLLAFQIGQVLLPGVQTLPPLPNTGLGFATWFEDLMAWVKALGWPLLAGLPVLGLILATLTYVVINVLWLAPTFKRLWARRRKAGRV